MRECRAGCERLGCKPAANNSCAELNFAGIDTWRLPDIKELFGVIDLDSDRFAPAQDRLRSWSDRALSAAFGTSAVYGNSTPYPVRCVSYPQ